MEARKVSSFEFDRRHQTADADVSNNVFPPRPPQSRIDVLRSDRGRVARNQMAEALTELKKKASDETPTASAPLTPASAP